MTYHNLIVPSEYFEFTRLDEQKSYHRTGLHIEVPKPFGQAPWRIGETEALHIYHFDNQLSGFLCQTVKLGQGWHQRVLQLQCLSLSQVANYLLDLPSKSSRAKEVQPNAEIYMSIEVTRCNFEKSLPPNRLDTANKIDIVRTLKFATSCVSGFPLFAPKLKRTASICLSLAIPT